MMTDTLNISARFGDITHALRGPERTGCELPPSLWVGRNVMVVTDQPVTCRRGCGNVSHTVLPAPTEQQQVRDREHADNLAAETQPDLSDVPAGTARGTYATHGKPEQVMYYGRKTAPQGPGYLVTLRYAERVISVMPEDDRPGHADTFGPNVKFWAGPPAPQDLD